MLHSCDTSHGFRVAIKLLRELAWCPRLDDPRGISWVGVNPQPDDGRGIGRWKHEDALGDSSRGQSAKLIVGGPGFRKHRNRFAAEGLSREHIRLIEFQRATLGGIAGTRSSKNLVSNQQYVDCKTVVWALERLEWRGETDASLTPTPFRSPSVLQYFAIAAAGIL
jgi:hypothetical protein